MIRKIVLKDRKTDEVTCEIIMEVNHDNAQISSYGSVLDNKVEIQDDTGKVIRKYEMLSDTLLVLIEP